MPAVTALLAALGAFLLALTQAQAADNTFTGASNGSWATGSNWDLSHAPTSSENVFSNNGTNARITATTAAVAASVTIGGATGTSSVQLHSTGTNSLTVSGNITLAPGAGNGTLTLEGASTLTLNAGAGSIVNGGGGGTASLVGQGGFSGSLGLATATVYDLNMAQTGNGTLTINTGQTYNVSNLVRLNNNGTTGTAGAININGGTLNVGDTVGSGVGQLRLNSGTGAGNTAYVNINSGGTLKAELIQRQNLGTDAAINWNDGTIANYAGSNLTLQAQAGAGTLNVFLAGTGTHTFDADSGRTITVASTAVLADKSGENGKLTKAGLGTLTLNGANTHSGTTTVSAGTLALGHVNALQNSTLDTGTAGAQSVTFTVAGTNTYNLGGLQGSDDLAIGGNTVSVGSNNAITSFSGAISGTGGLTKAGTSGTLTLSGTNTYTGATTVSEGTLLVNGSVSSSTGGVTVASGATLGGTGTLGGATTVYSGGKLTAGADGTTGTLSFTNGLTVATGATWLLDIQNANTDLIAVTGNLVISDSTLSLGGGNLYSQPSYTIATYSGMLTGSFLDLDEGEQVGTSGYYISYGDRNDGSITLTAIPEPETWLPALLIAGLGRSLRRRRCKHHQVPGSGR